MSDYPGVTKAELEQDILPIIRGYLEGTGRTRFMPNGHDINGHEVHGFGAEDNPTKMGAYVVYEGWEWVLEFIEVWNGCIDAYDRTYEIEAYTNYELNVCIMDDYR